MSKLFLFLILAVGSNQNDTLIHKVMRSFPNGQPKVEYCYDAINKKMVKEIVYYESGIVDYTGEYKDGREHGEWIYYWETGVIRSKEFYQNGLEEGVMYDYNEEGIPIIEFTYLQGILLQKKENLQYPKIIKK